MFEPSDVQRSLLDARGLLPGAKRRRCEATWAEVFGRNALPILSRVESEFADLFHPEVGRQNRDVELVLGVVLFKDVDHLTNSKGLDAVERHALGWWEFQRESQELHFSKNSVHDFRLAVQEQQGSRGLSPASPAG